MPRTLVATDDFTGTQNSALDSAKWQQIGRWAGLGGDVSYSASNGFYGAADSSECAARWNGAGEFTDDQYSSVRIPFISDEWGSRIGVIARASADSGTGRDWYQFVVENRQSGGAYLAELRKVVNDVNTLLDNTPSTVSIAANDRIEIECEGTTIRGLVNGVETHSATDSDLTTGKPGIYAQGRAGSEFRGDDWEGGNITAGGGGGEISGSSALAISGAGTLTGSGTLTGAAGLAFAASAALNGAGELAGSGTLAFSAGAALKGAGALSGTTDLAFAASAALKGAGALAGSTASAFSASATLRGSGALSGAAALAFGASGSMAQGAISGSSQNIFSALGTLIGDGALSAAGGFAFVPTGTLSATVSISGSSALGFSVSGTLFDVDAIHTPRSRTRVVHKVERHALIVKTDRSALVKRRGRLH